MTESWHKIHCMAKTLCIPGPHTSGLRLFFGVLLGLLAPMKENLNAISQTTVASRVEAVSSRWRPVVHLSHVGLHILWVQCSGFKPKHMSVFVQMHVCDIELPMPPMRISYQLQNFPHSEKSNCMVNMDTRQYYTSSQPQI